MMKPLSFGPRVEGFIQTADTLSNNIIPLEVWKRVHQEITEKLRKTKNLQSEYGSSTKEISKATNAPGDDETAVDETRQQGDIFKTEPSATPLFLSSTLNSSDSHADDGFTSSGHEEDDDVRDSLDEALEELNQSSISAKLSLAKPQYDSSSNLCKRSRLNPYSHLAPAFPCLVKYSPSTRRVKTQIPENDPYMLEDSVWPTHFKLRCHVYQVPNSQSPLYKGKIGSRVIYFIQNCLRIKDNGGLEAAIHMARSLQMPLQAFVSVSEHTKACRTIAGIATASAFCGLEADLQKMGIPLLGIMGSPSTALQLLHEGLADGGVYSIVIDFSTHPKHMAAVAATAVSLPNVLLNIVDSNSFGPLREFHLHHVTKKNRSSTIETRRTDNTSKADVDAWCMRSEAEAMEWLTASEVKHEEKFPDDLQAPLYVDLNSTAHQSDHKKLFIPSSLYETPGIEIVDWGLLRSTSSPVLKSKESRRGQEHGNYDGTSSSSSSLITTKGAAEQIADIALSRLIDLLKNDRGRTIEEDLTGEGMRGDVLTLVRLGVISPLRVLYEIKTRARMALPAIREMLFLRDYYAYICHTKASRSIFASILPGPSASYKELGSDSAWTDEWFCQLLPDWVVTELKLHCADKRQQCYKEEIIFKGGGNDRLFTAIVKVLKDKGILHPFLGGYMGQAVITQSRDPFQGMKLALHMSREYSIGHEISVDVGSSLICNALEWNVVTAPQNRQIHPIFGRVAIVGADRVRAKWSDPLAFLLFLKSATQNQLQCEST